jgi:hypothetical protein
MIRPDVGPTGVTPTGARAWRRVRRARWIALLTVLSALTLSGVGTGPASAALPTWSVATTPNVGTASNEIAGVSCASETMCVAVGYRINGVGNRRTLAETLQGTTWSVAGTPNLGTLSNSFAGVSCASVTMCVAVGSAFNGTSLVTLIATWNGTAWSITTSPNRGTSTNELVGVSCPSTTSCVAVGYYTDAVGALRTLVETWQGTSWSVTASPNPGPTNAILNGVSCTGATSCVAVGYSLSAGGAFRTLVETWQGAAWSVTPSPSAQPNALLNGVSCASATSCVAVGWSGDAFRLTLVETWNGTAWSAVASPNPTGRLRYLRSVSCTTSARCIAVGSSFDGVTTRTLIEGWNGAAWSILASPNPAGPDSSLLGVSCASATSCVTGGHRVSAPAMQTLVLSGSASPDVTPPVVSMSTPVPGGYYVLGQTAAASYRCVDELGGSGTESCVGTVAVGAPIDT